MCFHQGRVGGSENQGTAAVCDGERLYSSLPASSLLSAEGLFANTECPKIEPVRSLLSPFALDGTTLPTGAP